MKVKTASVKSIGWIQLMSGVQSWFTATWFWKVSQYTKNRINTAFGLPLSLPFVKCFHLVSEISSINFKIGMTDRSMKIKSLVWLWTLCTGWICKWFSMALRFRWRSRYIWVKKLKIIIIKFYKIVKILRAPWLVKKQSLIAPVNLWKIEVYICY